jgi:hypothetical protein
MHADASKAFSPLRTYNIGSAKPGAPYWGLHVARWTFIWVVPCLIKMNVCSRAGT